MSTKTIDSFNLYTFHLAEMGVEVKKSVVKGKFLIRSNRNENETKEFYFHGTFKSREESSENGRSRLTWNIKAKDGQPIGKDLYQKLDVCLWNIVDQFGQVVPADDAFEFDFNTEGVLGEQLN
jgi:hypothetical protein